MTIQLITFEEVIKSPLYHQESPDIRLKRCLNKLKDAYEEKAFNYETIKTANDVYAQAGIRDYREIKLLNRIPFIIENGDTHQAVIKFENAVEQEYRKSRK